MTTRWTRKLGRIAGVDISVHATFLLLLAWIGIGHYLHRGRAGDVVAGLGFVVALFGIVVLHELAHALVARRYGIRTREIMLLPIGGVAQMERMPEQPRQELLIALAGPAVNLVLAGALYVVLGAPATVWPDPGDVGGELLPKLVWLNVTLALFNLVPAFPMDGGRILRALLSVSMDRVRATAMAARIGQGIAVLFAMVGIFGNPVLVFIAIFVWMGAAAEARVVQMTFVLAGVTVSQAMVTEFHTLAPTDTLRAAGARFLDGFQQEFPVVEAGRVVGMLTRAGLARGLQQHGGDGTVEAAMSAEFVSAEPSERLDAVVQRLEASGSLAAVVVRDEAIVGLLTAENVGELLMIRAALDRPTPSERT
jgi:Zn-dependent protease/CBS domain-containing protein